MRNRPHRQLFVRALSARATRGWLCLGGLTVPCALGRSGRTALKREGDGATPTGIFHLKRVFFRGDRAPRPRTALPTGVLKPCDGWCDAAGDRNYNRPVRHPYPASAEAMWRQDGLYDVVVVLDYFSACGARRSSADRRVRGSEEAGSVESPGACRSRCPAAGVSGALDPGKEIQGRKNGPGTREHSGSREEHV